MYVLYIWYYVLYIDAWLVRWYILRLGRMFVELYACVALRVYFHSRIDPASYDHRVFSFKFLNFFKFFFYYRVSFAVSLARPAIVSWGHESLGEGGSVTQLLALGCLFRVTPCTIAGGHYSTLHRVIRPITPPADIHSLYGSRFLRPLHAISCSCQPFILLFSSGRLLA